MSMRSDLAFDVRPTTRFAPLKRIVWLQSIRWDRVLALLFNCAVWALLIGGAVLMFHRGR
jgi:hypothetical protein